MVCISGANEAYERLEEVVGALRTVHDGVLMVAGRLGEREESLRGLGVNGFVAIGMDVVEHLESLFDDELEEVEA
ncbi:MAG: hypothetical protein ACYSWX_12860 [Planctomycetota bacterium]